MLPSQPGILSEVPTAARYLTFFLNNGANAQEAMHFLAEQVDIKPNVFGLGHSLLLDAKVSLKRLRDFPQMVGPGVEIPSTPAALWCWMKGDDRGELIHRSRALESLLAEYFHLGNVIDAFKYAEGRDLSGYIDGTENPTGDAAIEAGILQGQGEGLDGSSFVSVQQWVHDLDELDLMSPPQRDYTIGRRISDNEELDEAPAKAHVKRAAQESFSPEAFMVRRSMPWSDEQALGLVFVAFGKSFDAFESVLTRMAGLDDGLTDALFKFTQPISGAYFWCPPVKEGKLDLSILDF